MLNIINWFKTKFTKKNIIDIILKPFKFIKDCIFWLFNIKILKPFKFIKDCIFWLFNIKCKRTHRWIAHSHKNNFVHKLIGYGCKKCDKEITKEEYICIIQERQGRYALLQFLSAIILVAVTGQYVYYTRGMVTEMQNEAESVKKQTDITVKQFELSYTQNKNNNRPFVYISDFEQSGDVPVITLKNTGNIPAKIKMKEFTYKTKDMDYIMPTDGPEYDNILFPNLEDELRVMKSFDVKDVEAINKVLWNEDVIVIIKYDYWAITDKDALNKFSYYVKYKLIKDPRKLEVILPIIEEKDAN